MSETGKESEPASEVESKETASPKSQLVALLTLLPVLGVLWLVMQYLPKFGDWMGAKADTVVSAVSRAEGSPSVAEETVALASEGESMEGGKVSSDSGSEENSDKTRGAVSDGIPQKERFRSQIVEQLGGSDQAEVRHLAVSDDGERMVAALKLHGDTGGSGLIEVFFDRDDFGRFISSGDSPVPEKLVLWSE